MTQAPGVSENGRLCGACDLCCRVLRVDALAKRGGRACVHQVGNGGGCGIHAGRPRICRAYECLWLGGGLEEADRPDRLGAVIDIVREEGAPYLAIRQQRGGTFETSARLQAIADRFRETLPVRVTRAEDAENADRPYRVLLAAGVEQRIAGEWVEVWRSGERQSRSRMPWAERRLRALTLAWQRFRQRKMS